MRALSKLINLNEPDLVLFVGEALVGNDGVDQLTKFNQVSLCTLLHNAQACDLWLKNTNRRLGKACNSLFLNKLQEGRGSVSIFPVSSQCQDTAR